MAGSGERLIEPVGLRKSRRWHPHPKFNPKDLTGQKFGRLTFIRLLGRKPGRKGGQCYWETICECGNRKAAQWGRVKSCGCLAHELALDPVKWKQNPRRIELWGRLVTIQEAVNMTGLSKHAVRHRLAKGHPLDVLIPGRGGTNGAERETWRRRMGQYKRRYGAKT